jgi:hypothetical protein
LETGTILGLWVTHDPLCVLPPDFLTFRCLGLGGNLVPTLVVVDLFDGVVSFETIQSHKSPYRVRNAVVGGVKLLV